MRDIMVQKLSEYFKNNKVSGYRYSLDPKAPYTLKEICKVFGTYERALQEAIKYQKSQVRVYLKSQMQAQMVTAPAPVVAEDVAPKVETPKVDLAALAAQKLEELKNGTE